MVLFKRKPVQFVTNPEVEDEEKEVWLISQTGEFFVDYEAYLNRMDFYKQHRFICQITGHSGLSFFEALKSELAGAQEVEQAFPEALKDPILRRVQFQTISRIDTLVDLIFDEFRSNYFPGEAVTVHVVTGERLTGVVRDKTRFGEKKLPDGPKSEPFSRYFVSLDNRPMEEAVVDDAHITRDRKIFTKQVLRSFIKKTVTREAWNGAPWLVKPEVAALYRIDARVPPHLRYESKVVERKQNLQYKKATAPNVEALETFAGGSNDPAQGQGLPDLKPSKSHKSKQQQAGKSKQQRFLNHAPSIPQYGQQSFVAHTFQAHGPPPVGPHFSNFHNATFAFTPIAAVPPIAAPPPPPPIKYPIEDLQVPPRPNGPKRPALKYFSQDTPMLTEQAEGNGISMKSVGPLLESWDTLNVYCEIFKLDSFTLDDFVEAMQFTSEDVTCELFVEAHCAALKLLVGSEAEGGKVHVRLPELDEEDEEESGQEDAPEPTPETETKPTGRATRSSLAKAEAEALKQEEAREKSSTPLHKHRAAEMQAEMHWIERLEKRDFKNGGWEFIIVGLLHQLSKNPRHHNACEELLEQLAPMHMDPTKETARQQYPRLDVNLRIQALEIVCMLCAETKAIRGYMEECSELMTGYRKEKIVFQRDRKALLEELRPLNEERKILLPANMPPSPGPEQPATNGDTKMHDTEEEIHDSVEDDVIDTDEDPHQGRSLRRGIDRAAQRKRKREEEREEKKKAEAEAKIPKQSKQFTKLMKDIQKKEEKVKECEDEIAVLDNDLREADCPRTRVLGKDRFWNRYYWFERNGMPYGGLPNSSTAEAGYANGCLWVQGPDDLEREGYIEMKLEWQNEYYSKFNMTVPERKVMEEGPTHVFNARQWGYFEDPEAVEGLLAWLDPRGFNEMKLKKELLLYREKIVKHMENRKEFLKPTKEKSVESNKRVSIRKQQQPDYTAHRCLSWHNQMAVEELGHLHLDEPRQRKQAKKASIVTAPIVVEDPAPIKTRSEAKGKKGKEKSLGRQGTRYNFSFASL